MRNSIDVAEVTSQVKDYLGTYGFEPRDADITDLASDTYPGLRFKVGTSHKEVTIVPVVHNRRVKVPIRINTDVGGEAIANGLDAIHAKIKAFATGDESA